MSVIPTGPEVPAEPTVPDAPTATPAPQLRLVPAHEHSWRLLSVEYDEPLEVRRYECETCADVLFR